MIEGQHGENSNCFVRGPLVRHLGACVGKTLGDLDLAEVFKRNAGKPKVTGIAGDVIEQSILQLRSNSKQEPDIEVNDVKYEVKTTGVRKPKRGDALWEAKEPMTITAVSPETITSECYSDSAFWHKIEHLLIFYYHYNSPTTVKAFEYANFPLLDYQFHEASDFSQEEREMLQGDWEQIRSFIDYLQTNYGDACTDEYPRLSHELRETLLLLDTAPKWPNRPRFRFKRSFVSSIVQKHFSTKRLEQLPESIPNFRELDEKCHELQMKYRGLTVGQLCKEFGLKVAKDFKAITEPIIIRMFGGKSKSMRQVEFFSKVGVWGKSFTITRAGGRTEDAKFFTIDFDEFMEDSISFEDSQFYEFFSSNRILIAVFEEPDLQSPLTDNKFIGFRTIVFREDFINNEVRDLWNRIRDLIRNNKLRDVPVLDSRGRQVINKTGIPSSAPNLPKASEGPLFVRGTGRDSSDKRECVNGIKMYSQQVWIRGDYIAKLLEDTYPVAKSASA